MPDYQYSCKKGHELDLFRSIVDEPSVYCPMCKQKMHRLIFPTPSHFKGGGWSQDNYHKEKK